MAAKQAQINHHPSTTVLQSWYEVFMLILFRAPVVYSDTALET